jgi:hypothetical protein
VDAGERLRTARAVAIDIDGYGRDAGQRLRRLRMSRSRDPPVT